MIHLQVEYFYFWSNCYQIHSKKQLSNKVIFTNFIIIKQLHFSNRRTVSSWVWYSKSLIKTNKLKIKSARKFKMLIFDQTLGNLGWWNIPSESDCPLSKNLPEIWKKNFKSDVHIYSFLPWRINRKVPWKLPWKL